MLIVQVKEGESIERALKKYKKKYDKTGVVKQLRNRKEFTKPSVIKRQALIKAVYKQKMQVQEVLRYNIFSKIRIRSSI
ncbi:MAG: 30S ribosomal protein S21 [Crocinitomicaceae bacterium]